MAALAAAATEPTATTSSESSSSLVDFLASLKGKVKFYSNNNNNNNNNNGKAQDELVNAEMISGHCEYLTLYKVFPRQIQAFHYFDSLDITIKSKYKIKLFSFESKLTGKRKFLVASWNEFFRNYMDEDDATSKRRCHHGHYYEIIREGFPCRPYFDLEFSIPDNPQVHGDSLVATWVDLVLWKLYQLYGLCLDESHVIVLDSSSSIKFSKHVIIHVSSTQIDQSENEFLFQNNGILGEFVESIIFDITTPTSNSDIRVPLPAYQSLWVQAKDATSKTCFVDLGVYTRNRMFRIFGCTKYGKHVTLKIAPYDKRRYLGLHQDRCNTTSSTSIIIHPKSSTIPSSSSISLSRHELFETFLHRSFVVPLSIYSRMNADILCHAKLQFRTEDNNEMTTMELTDYTVNHAFCTKYLLCYISRHASFSIPHSYRVDHHHQSSFDCLDGVPASFQTLLDNLIEFTSGSEISSQTYGDDETVGSQGTQGTHHSQPSQASTIHFTQQQHSHSQSQIKSQSSRRALTPVSIAALGSRATTNTGGGGGRAGRAEWEDRVISRSTYTNLNTSPFPELDAFVLKCVGVGGVQGRLNGWTIYHSAFSSSSSSGMELSSSSSSASVNNIMNTASNSVDQNKLSCHNGSTLQGAHGNNICEPRTSRHYHIRYQIANNKFCGNVGRAHKSNGIMIDVDLSRGLAYQWCWDPDCRGYRSAPISVPQQCRPDVSAIEEYHSDVEMLKYMENNPVLFG